MEKLANSTSLTSITTRLELLKKSYPNLRKIVEDLVINKHVKGIKDEYILSWSEWIKCALYSIAPEYVRNAPVNAPVPLEILAKLPIPMIELVTVGTWMYTKNIYRFKNELAQLITKTPFKREVPVDLLHLKELSLYVQTDNMKLDFAGQEIEGVMYTKNVLNGVPVLLTTLFFKSGPTFSTAMILETGKTIEYGILEFIRQNHSDQAILDDQTVQEVLRIQKLTVNILLWFSQKEPEVMAINVGNKEQYFIKRTKGKFKLIESKNYREFVVGHETAQLIQEAKQQIKNCDRKGIEPQIRLPHWQLYWLGKKGSFDQYEIKWKSKYYVGVQAK
ncbi:TPA: hypothetical protein MW242_002619 [Acinetobacter baumannii]|nr:hypothetical protein [Acinetobacter baumannii]